MFHTCSICLDDVIIPVEITIFPCCNNHERNCYSFKRLCESCVLRYLELELKVKDRSFYKKCLFCDSYINPQEIVGKSYKKDYMFMSMDTRILQCKNCDFKGSHLDLEKHVEKDCSKKLTECFCNVIDTREILESPEHRKTCCFFKQCLICNEFVYCNDLEKHLGILHNMINCGLCQKPTTLSINLHLKNECPMRLIKCKHCSETLIANLYLDHLIEHTNDCKKRLSLLQDLKIKEMDLFSILSKDIQNIYEVTYGGPIEEL